MSGTSGGPINREFQERLQRVAGPRHSMVQESVLERTPEPRRKRSPVVFLFSIGVALVVGAFGFALLSGGGNSSGSDAAVQVSPTPITFAPLERKSFDRPSFEIDLPGKLKAISEERLRELAEEDDSLRIVSGFEEPTVVAGASAFTFLVSQERSRDLTVSEMAEGAQTVYGILGFLGWFGLPKFEIVDGPDLFKLDGFEAARLLSRDVRKEAVFITDFVFIDTGYEILILQFAWLEGVIERSEVDRILATIDVK